MGQNDSRESIIERRGYRKDIIGDKSSLYISNYPITVSYLKQRISNSDKILLELCCGIGITIEYIADGFKQVIGVDINKKILNQCENNLKNVGLLQKCTLILGDINEDSVLKNIKADLVIYDIPFWQEDLINKNPLLKSIIERIRKFISEDIIIFCPPKFNYKTIETQVGSCEFQKVFINGKHDKNHVYLGKLKQQNGVTELRLTN